MNEIAFNQNTNPPLKSSRSQGPDKRFQPKLIGTKKFSKTLAAILGHTFTCEQRGRAGSGYPALPGCSPPRWWSWSTATTGWPAPHLSARSGVAGIVTWRLGLGGLPVAGLGPRIRSRLPEMELRVGLGRRECGVERVMLRPPLLQHWTEVRWDTGLICWFPLFGQQNNQSYE